MSNLYISPPSRLNDNLENSPKSINNYSPKFNNLKNRPTLNEKLLNKRMYRPRLLQSNQGNSLTSKHYGDPPFFTNAKPAAMLERGLVRNTDELYPNDTGLYIISDGPELEVTVIKGGHLRQDGNGVYSFLDNNTGKIFEALVDERYEKWDLYNRTKPKKFIPKSKKFSLFRPSTWRRRGGSKKNKTRRT